MAKPSRSTEQRKEFSMIKIISMISLCLVALQSDGESLESWLRSLPQVKAVTSYDVTNADCILIHMRQEHPDPLQIRKAKIGSWALLKGVRDDIFAVGTNLQSRFSISSYYPEGYTKNDADSIAAEVKAGRTEFKRDQAAQKQDEDERREAEAELAKLKAATVTHTNAEQMQMMRLYKRILS